MDDVMKLSTEDRHAIGKAEQMQERVVAVRCHTLAIDRIEGF